MQHLVKGYAVDAQACIDHIPQTTEQKGCQELTLQAATSHTSLSTVTFTPSTSMVAVASTDAADEVPKQERTTANESGRRMPLHCAMVTWCYSRYAALMQISSHNPSILRPDCVLLTVGPYGRSSYAQVASQWPNFTSVV